MHSIHSSRFHAGFSAILCVVILLVAGCGKPSAAPAPPAPPPSVTSAVVTSRDIPIYIDQIGKCVSPETVMVRPQASGRIVKIHFADGANLKPGQTLFTIDPAPYQAAVDQAQAAVEMDTAAVEQSEATLAQNRAQLEEAKAELSQMKLRQQLNVIEFDRSKNLFEATAGSKQDFDAKRMARDVGEAQIRASEASLLRMEAQIKQGIATVSMANAHVKSAEAAVHTAKINLEYCTITSPIEGRAGQRLVDQGNVVNANIPGNATVLLTIERLDPIYVEFSVPERELENVQESMKAGRLKAECRVPERANAPRDGEVFFIDNAVQDGTGTIKLRARLKNADRFFWPGQFVKVRLIYEIKKDAPLVPAEAVQIGQDGPFVFVIKDDSTVELRPIKPGLRYDNLIAVNDGLKRGETVVLTGQLMLQPGSKVTVDNPKPGFWGFAKFGWRPDMKTPEKKP